MKKILSKVVLCFFISFLTNVLVANEDPLTVMAADLFPYGYPDKNGQPTGAYVEITSKIQEKLNEQISMSIVPYRRMYATLEKNTENVIGFPVARFPNREKLFHWLHYLSDDALIFVSLKGNKIPQEIINFNINEINKMPRAKHFKIGVVRGTLMEQYLLKRKIPPEMLSSLVNPAQNAQMLFSGRIDAIFSAKSIFNFILNKEFSAHIDEVKIYPDSLNFPVYINSNLDLSPNIKQKWKRTIRSLVHNGTVKKILDKYNMTSTPNLYED